MNFLNNISIRYKQGLIIMVTSTVVLLLACAAFVAYDAFTFRRMLVDDMSILAEVVGSNCAAAIDFHDERTAAEALGGLRANPHIVSAAVYSADGERFAVYEREGDSVSPPSMVAGGAGHEFTRDRLNLVRPIERQGEEIGAILVTSDLNALVSRLTRFTGIVAVVLLASLLLAFVLSSYLQRAVSGPILQLARLTRTVALEKDYSRRVAPQGRDELGQLVDGFNGMLDQIQARDQALMEARDGLERRVEERSAELKREIAERQRSEEELRQTNHRFELVALATTNVIWDWDLTADSIWWNRNFATVFGFPDSDVASTGESWASLLHPDDRDEVVASIHNAQQGRAQLWSMEYRLRRHDDSYAFVFDRGYILRDEDGRAVRMIGAIQDITEGAEAEAVLRRTEELYRRAIGGAGAVPYSLDYRKRSYVFLGEGIRDLIGYASEEVNGQLWKSIIRETIMLGEAEGLNSDEASAGVLESRIRTWRADMHVRTRDGKMRWLSDVSVQTWDESGRTVGSMGILQDITERKQAEISASIFSQLGQDLASSTSVTEAGRLIGKAADTLLGWDAYAVSLYSEENDLIYGILNIDTIDGERAEFDSIAPHPPTDITRRIFAQGGELILRDRPTEPVAEMNPFGDKSRPSASLLYVPIRYGSRLLGILTIQSYTFNAYTEADRRTLQELGDRCAGAMERIWAEEAQRKSESQFRLIWESSGDGMRLATEEGLVQTVNDAYCRMVGKARSELEGNPISVIQPEERRKRILSDHRERMAAADTRSRREVEVELWNGRRTWFEVTDSLLELPGQPLLLLTITRDITERKEAEAKLTALHHQLIDASRQAGMAEIATNVLHNVGNVLNSVNVSANLIGDSIRQSRVTSLQKVVALLREHEADLGTFVVSDRGKQLPEYLGQLAGHLEAERERVAGETESLRNNIEHIKQIVAMQQNYASVSGVTELVDIVGLVEDSLRLNAGALSRHKVELARDFQEVPALNVEKHKILQILVNLVRNAKYACDDTGRADKRVTARVARVDGCIQISIADNGVGIPPENLTRIFSHGFTTRSDGHGFGLHSSALAAREIGGTLRVESDGPGQGATFTLEIPLGTAAASVPDKPSSLTSTL